MPVEFDPTSASWRDDPYPKYRELRDHAPVHHATSTSLKEDLYSVSRYDDVMYVLKHPELFSSDAMRTVLMDADMGPIGPRYVFAIARFLWRAKLNVFALQARGSLISNDGTRHDVMRAIVNRGFTPRRIRDWEARVHEVVAERTAGIDVLEVFDVVRDLAIPLPVAIIAEMLGIPAERHADFKRWSDNIIHLATGGGKENPFEPGVLESFEELFAFLRQQVRARRKQPADDLISTLVDPSQDAALDELDMIQFVVLLLVAGNETTTNLIGNAVHALLDHPEALERVARDPALVPALLEETLRFDSPIQLVFRTATQDVEVAGTRIPKGAVVVPLLASANRDERRFPNPDRFDLDRDTRGHVGFGFGVHFCLGASLARLEATAALEALAPELPRLKRTDTASPLIDSFLVRGRRSLELAPASARA